VKIIFPTLFAFFICELPAVDGRHRFQTAADNDFYSNGGTNSMLGAFIVFRPKLARQRKMYKG